MKNSTAPRGLSALFQPIDLTEGTCWKTILRFSFPIILSYLLQQVYSISDAAIVGQTLSAEEVAGVNDIAPIVNIFLQFAFGVSAGFCVITSCNVGSHNQPGVRRSLATQIVLSSVLTVLLTGLALLLLNPMLAWINVTKDSGAVYTAAFTYCAIIFAGIGAQLFYNFICSFLRAMGDSVTPLVFLLFSTILNVGLDLLFILSFHWGVAGAAIATVLAQLISTVGCFLYAFSKYPELRLHRPDFAITKNDVTQHIVQGVPLGLQFSVLSIGIITMQSVIVQFDMEAGRIVSSAAQTGFGAANRLHMLTMTPLNAFGTAMTSFTAQDLGASKFDRIRRGSFSQRRQNYAGDHPLRQYVPVRRLCDLSDARRYFPDAKLRPGYRQGLLRADRGRGRACGKNCRQHIPSRGYRGRRGERVGKPACVLRPVRG